MTGAMRMRESASSKEAQCSLARATAPAHTPAMDRDIAIERLRRHASDLAARGASHMSLFGSTARGEARQDSDVDLLVDLDPAHRFTLVKLAQLRRYVSELLDAEAEITLREDVKPFLRDSIVEDEIRVF